ncbi:MAG: MFS transporter, partial [Pseudonocardiaceae bacterium]
MRVRNFRLYFVGQLCSISGNNAQTVAMGWLVLQLSGSGTALGAITAAQFLPLLVLSPLLGAFVDRFDRRRILMVTQVCALSIAGLLAVLSLCDRATVLGIGVLALMLGIVNAVDYPARQTFIRDMVGIELLSNAVALNNVLMGSARIVGPVVAGLVIAFVGIPACFFFNAASFVAVLVALWAMRIAEGSDRPVVADRPTLRGGFRYVLDTPEVRSGLALMALVGTFTYEFWVTLPVLAREVFQQDASGYASMMTVLSIGSVIGGLVVARRASVGRRDLLIATAGFGATTLMVGLSPSLEIAFVTILLMGVAYSAFAVLSGSVLQSSLAPAFQGRIMALWTAAFAGSTTVGGPIMGWIIDAYGARTALAVGGLVALIAAGGFAVRRAVDSETGIP